MERNKEETKKTYTRQYIISYYSFHQKERINTKERQSANSYTPKIVYIENNQQQDAAFSTEDNTMSTSEKETKIIKRIFSKRKTNNPLLVIYPNNKEVWCQSVDIHESSSMECKNGILTTTTNGHVVTHIALEKEDKKVKYQPGMISAAGVEWALPDQEIDFD